MSLKIVPQIFKILFQTGDIFWSSVKSETHFGREAIENKYAKVLKEKCYSARLHWKR